MDETEHRSTAMGWHESEPEASPHELEPLPRLEEIPAATQGPGLDPARVADAFESFHRQLSWYRTQATSVPAIVETGRQEARTDALKLIRAAAEFADVLERDAQEVAARQMGRVDGEIRRREGDLRERERSLRLEKEELDRRRSEVLAAARREADGIVAAAHRAGAEARHEAELAKLRVLEEARRQVAELTNATRAEVEHTLEWSRAQAEGIVRRARAVAEQLLAASMRGDDRVVELVDAIVQSAETQVGPMPSTLATPPRVGLPPATPERSEEPASRQASDRQEPDPRPAETVSESSVSAPESEPEPERWSLPPDPGRRPDGPEPESVVTAPEAERRVWIEPELHDPPVRSAADELHGDRPRKDDQGSARPAGFADGHLQPTPEPVRFSWLPAGDGDRPAA